MVATSFPSCGGTIRLPTVESSEVGIMAQVNVRIPTMLRAAVGGASSVSSTGDDVGQVIAELVDRYPALQEYLVDNTGAVRKFVNLYVNEQDIRILEKVSTPLSDGDELSILPAVAGG
jgi:MoaD family protein